MNTFLDKAGLAYFWGKIKSELDSKADTVAITTEQIDAIITGSSFDDGILTIYSSYEATQNGSKLEVI